MAAVATDLVVTAGLVASLALLALLAFLRLMLRKHPPTWRKLKMGIFVEHDPHDEEKD